MPEAFPVCGQGEGDKKTAGLVEIDSQALLLSWWL